MVIDLLKLTFVPVLDFIKSLVISKAGKKHEELLTVITENNKVILEKVAVIDSAQKVINDGLLQISTSMEVLHRLVDKLQKLHDNNVYTDLMAELSDITDELDMDDKQDKLLHVYFTNKLRDVAGHYNIFRNAYYKNSSDINILKDITFTQALLGNGRVELVQLCEGFPEEFLNFVVAQNTKDYDSFVSNVQFVLSTTDESEVLEVVKVNMYKAFRSNVQKIHKKYSTTKHLIKCNKCNKCQNI